jgi:glycosyltransferase involved in cell wall biosynthesis
VIANTDSPLDKVALEKFAERFGNPQFNPVTVVVPAYDEEGTIGEVISEIAPEIAGLKSSVLVMVDGGTDRTADIALERGAFVSKFDGNRGQGIALRLGYRIALEHGAQYVVITDGDGQWPASEIEALVKPLVADEADMVQGSRRLGTAPNKDKLRATGVVFFSRLISLLTGTTITDSSTGIRAFKAEVLPKLSFTQIQYQASEVLIEILSLGYRVKEVPVNHRERTAGESKKGHNLLYGFRYARVILRTWWRVRPRFKSA